MEFGKSVHAVRKPSVEAMLQLLVGPSIHAALPSMRHAQYPLATPRVDDRLHITFIQMGGTIE
jgi:hypothetical protein